MSNVITAAIEIAERAKTLQTNRLNAIVQAGVLAELRSFPNAGYRKFLYYSRHGESHSGWRYYVIESLSLKHGGVAIDLASPAREALPQERHEYWEKQRVTEEILGDQEKSALRRRKREELGWPIKEACREWASLIFSRSPTYAGTDEERDLMALEYAEACWDEVMQLDLLMWLEERTR